MAKQPQRFGSAREGAATGQGGAPVGVAEDVGGSAQGDENGAPVPPERAALMADIRSMYDDTSRLIGGIEAHARAASVAREHDSHTAFSRLAIVFGEFRAGLATVLSTPEE